MKKVKWLGLFAAALLIISSWLPWAYIESRSITITGFNSTGTNFGAPAYFHLMMVAIFIPLTLIPKLWAKRLNLFVVAINTSWMLRNILVLSICRGGDCPERKMGIYLMVFSSIVMLISALFPDMKSVKTKL